MQVYIYPITVTFNQVFSLNWTSRFSGPVQFYLSQRSSKVIRVTAAFRGLQMRVSLHLANLALANLALLDLSWTLLGGWCCVTSRGVSGYVTRGVLGN